MTDLFSAERKFMYESGFYVASRYFKHNILYEDLRKRHACTFPGSLFNINHGNRFDHHANRIIKILMMDSFLEGCISAGYLTPLILENETRAILEPEWLLRDPSKDFR